MVLGSATDNRVFRTEATMEVKYFLLAVVMVYNQDIVWSHILTPREMPLSSCINTLSFAVEELCAVYGGNSSEDVFDTLLIPQQMDKRYVRPHVVQRCCTQPCTISQLLSAC